MLLNRKSIIKEFIVKEELKEHLSEGWIFIVMFMICLGFIIWFSNSMDKANAEYERQKIEQAERIKNTNILKLQIFRRLYTLNNFVRDKRVKKIIREEGWLTDKYTVYYYEL